MTVDRDIETVRDERLMRFCRGIPWYDEIREDVGALLNERARLASRITRLEEIADAAAALEIP